MPKPKTKKYLKHIAIAYCSDCFDVIVSEGGGRFGTCSCLKSFIDQERYDARWVRLGGHAVLVAQFCPRKCKQEGHKNNTKLP